VTNQDEELLAELLLRWEELHERGQDTPASALAKNRLDLVEELDRRIGVLKDTAWLDKPIEDDPEADDPRLISPHSPRTLSGRYRLDELIAQGGFAEVYRAYDTELQRTVAVKMPKPGRLESTESFQAEARRVARLKHENIVPVFDVGLEDDTCFIVTEYIEGGSLADMIVSRSVAPEQAVGWACDIADALEYAHLNGVIHLDIKPANILIGANGRAKLADFGIAKSATKTGEFAPSLGTLRYMSTEQLEGRPTDHRSDIYSLAVVLYEALTGSLPYSSAESNVLRKEIVEGTALPSKGVPRELGQVLTKAMARSPHERHASATQFASEIRRAGVSRTPSSRWPLFGLLACLGLLVVGAGIAFTVAQPAGPKRNEPETASLQEVMSVATTNMHHEQYAKAEAGFTRALEIDTENLEALKKRGLCRLNTERPDRAAMDFDRVLARRPDDATTLRYRSKAYALLRDFPRAIADLEQVMILMPKASEVPGEMATVYALRSLERYEQGDYQGAKDDMDTTIRFAPEAAVNYSRRGACWFQMGEYEKAVDDFTDAIRRDSRQAEFYGKRSLALQKMGRFEDASNDQHKAEELTK
jgi:tetratricopeptide (TPR) repeat protein